VTYQEQILLRLEKYHYRMNFARGILESRNVTYDKSMRRLAKPLPLDTPTVIELSPDNTIRVTLLDANHCVGAVMFLIEGDGKAILYTGDIRAETWWVNSIVRNPVLLPYTCGSRHLDCVYLDTTFATKSEPYREFPSKADGIRELLERVAGYPEDTIFYFHSWTFGYENVWIALSNFLKSQIHLDAYRSRIYGSLSSLRNKQLKELGHDIRESPALCGYKNGNHFQPGCLTDNSNVRIHSCERGMGCPVIDGDTAAKVVRIIPIITRSDGAEIAEIGAGGGKGDLDQKEELETGNAVEVGKLMELCAQTIEDAELLSKVLAILQRSLADGTHHIELGQALKKESQGEEDDISLPTLVSVLSNRAEEASEESTDETIRFPYSRHSSYSELCTLVDALKPKDVYPCTVDEETWNPTVSMRSLFGHFCSENHFRHDDEMKDAYEYRLERERNECRDGETQVSRAESEVDHIESPVARKRRRLGTDAVTDGSQHPDETATELSPLRSIIYESTIIDSEGATSPSLSFRIENSPSPRPHQGHALQSSKEGIPDNQAGVETPSPITPPTGTSASSSTTLQERRIWRYNKWLAFNAVLGVGLTWEDFGGLVSTRKSEQDEVEL
jgi:hypothetical protein